MNGTPPDHDKLTNFLDRFVELIRSNQWSALLIYIDSIFIFLLMPDKGLAYAAFTKLLPGQYDFLIWVIFIIVFCCAVFIKLLGWDQPIRLRPRLKKFFIWVVIIIALIFVIRNLAILLPNTSARYQERDGISWGEEFLIPEDSSCKSFKGSGTEAYNRQKPDYESAIRNYSQYVKQCKDATEAQIYLNNARAMQTKNPMQVIVSVPISRKDGICDSKEILRGVAIAQDEWNSKDRYKKLLVGIIDDGDGSATGCDTNLPADQKQTGSCGIKRDQGECRKARDVANKLIKQKDIVGVIGHFSSDATEAAAKIYENGKLVAISPTSTAIRNKKESKCSEDVVCLNSYIFRTAANDSIVIRKLIDKIPSGIKKIAVVYEGESTYSRFFKETFTKEFQRKQGKLDGRDAIVNSQADNLENPCNFSISRGFDPKICLDAALKKGANALLLVPTTQNASNVSEILEVNSSSPSLDLLGSDSMYKETFITEKNQKRAEAMLVTVSWHRSDDLCETISNRLECKAVRLVSSLDAQVSNQREPPLKISWRTATAYDATQVLLDGLKRTTEQKCSLSIFGLNLFDHGVTCLRENVRDVLLSTEAGGGLGTKIKFDEDGDRIDDGKIGVVVEARAGKFVQK